MSSIVTVLTDNLTIVPSDHLFLWLLLLLFFVLAIRKKTTLLVYFLLFTITIQDLRLILFKVSVRYSDLIMIFFIFYYLFYEVKKAEELFAAKNVLSFIALLFFILVVSQLQARFIDFPFTSMRPGAIANYPYIKSIVRLLQVALLMLFSLCIAHYANKISLRRIVKMHTNVAAVISVLLIIIFFSNLILPTNELVKKTSARSDERFVRMKGFFGEPSLLALYLLTSIPFLMVSFLSFPTKKEAVGLCSQLFCLFITFSRAGWIAFAVVLLVAAYVLRDSYKHKIILYKKQLSFIVLMSIFLGSIILISFEPARALVNDAGIKHFTQALDSSNTGKFWSTRLRLEAYKDAIHAFQLHPFFGVGIFNFHFYGGYYFYAGLLDNSFYFNHAETNNLFLTVIAELGLVGLAFALFCGFLVIRWFIRRYRLIKNERGEREIAQGFMLSVVAIFIVFQFLSKFTYVFLWFFLGLCIACSYAQKSKNFIRTYQSPEA